MFQTLLAQTRTFNPAGPNPEVVPPTPGAVADVATLKGLETIFYNIVAVSLALSGLVLFIILLVGGFKYLTAGDNEESIAGAKKTLTIAFIGFIVIVAAFLILRLIEQFTGVKVTEFKVTQ